MVGPAHRSDLSEGLGVTHPLDLTGRSFLCLASAPFRRCQPFYFCTQMLGSVLPRRFIMLVVHINAAPSPSLGGEEVALLPSTITRRSSSGTLCPLLKQAVNLLSPVLGLGSGGFLDGGLCLHCNRNPGRRGQRLSHRLLAIVALRCYPWHVEYRAEPRARHIQQQQFLEGIWHRWTLKCQ